MRIIDSWKPSIAVGSGYRAARNLFLTVMLFGAVFTGSVSAKPSVDGLALQGAASNAENVVVFVRDNVIYRTAQNRVIELVKAGDEAPGTNGGRFRTFGAIAFNTSSVLGQDNSTFVFKALLDGSGHTEGIFFISQNRLGSVVLTGAIAPETGGGQFSGFGDQLAVTSDVFFGLTSGVIVFKGYVQGGKAREGIFATRAETMIAVGVEGQPAENTGGGQFDSFGRFSISDLGVVAFIANVRGSDITQGIYLSVPIPLGLPVLLIDITVPAALVGQPAPETQNANYAGFNDVSISLDNSAFNLIHELSFAASLGGGEPTSPRSGLFRIAFFAVIPITNRLVLEGQEAPQSEHGKFTSFSQLVANNMNQLSFYAEVTGAPFTAGLYQVTTGPFTLLTKSLELGSVAPDTGGGIFSTIENSTFSDNGRVVFTATITNGSVPEGVFWLAAKRVNRVRTDP